MEIEKTLYLDAPADQVWALLLNPQEMSRCVPGMESVEILSDDEYLAVMKVKISFISARFKLKTRIVEKDAPRYLRAEGTGEDASVASSLKQVSEMWLTATPAGGTEVRMKVVVDVLGRLGTFGLGVMKTKADRMWDEFGVNASQRLAGGELPGGPVVAAPGAAPAAAQPAAAVPAAPAMPSAPVPTAAVPTAAVPTGAVPTAAASPAALPAAVTQALSAAPAASAPARRGLWSRLTGSSERIDIDLQKGDLRIRVSWPAHAAAECSAWLRTLN